MNISSENVKKLVLNTIKGPKAYSEYSNNMQDVFENIDDYDSGKIQKY